MSDYKITEATLTDVAALCKLVNGAYRGESSKKGWTTEADLIEGDGITEDLLRDDMRSSDATILKATNDEGKIIACVYLKGEEEKLYLGMLCVSPMLQAKGIGKLLLEAAEKYAALLNKKIIMMTVISVRTELIAWYERQGYQKTGAVLPFHADKKFGRPGMALELVVLEKVL